MSQTHHAAALGPPEGFEALVLASAHHDGAIGADTTGLAVITLSQASQAHHAASLSPAEGLPSPAAREALAHYNGAISAHGEGGALCAPGQISQAHEFRGENGGGYELEAYQEWCVSVLAHAKQEQKRTSHKGELALWSHVAVPPKQEERDSGLRGSCRAHRPSRASNALISG
jgi:hypothetical protein